MEGVAGWYQVAPKDNKARAERLAASAGGCLPGLAFADVVRVRRMVMGFRNFVLRGVNAIVVFRVRLFMGLLAGERRSGTNRQKQNRCKKLLHESNPNMTRIVGRATPVTSVPKEQPGNYSQAEPENLRSDGEMRVAAVVMAMVVMVRRGGEHWTCERYQQQYRCKFLEHGSNPNMGLIEG